MLSRLLYLLSPLVIVLAVISDAHAAEPSPFDQRPQPWQRRDKPILSARTTREAWCKIVLYSPHVIYHDGKFRMWYLGTSTATRTNDIVMGYAESKNGTDWKPHADNPILTVEDVPWGKLWQTPYVMFNADEAIYKMWFVSGNGEKRDEKGQIVEMDQRLGYATSDDGIHWNVHPESIFASGRSPSVIKEGPKRYRMWMGSRPTDKSAWNDIYKYIYEFSSSDGIAWKRSEKPIIVPSGNVRSVVYPNVFKDGDTYRMWYGGHIDGGRFELFAAHSKDGSRWKIDHERPAFPARDGNTAFDSRYTSTPCFVRVKDRDLLFYSARDWQTEYIDAEGKKRRDNSSPYSHIGMATIRRSSKK
jgi:predicted GH43/DUF377 family glycosyl hydrolase